MAYRINPAALSSMFAVPTKVVDNCIKLASASQLKTLLWIYRHTAEPIDPAIISKDIGYSPADISDALVALCQWDVLVSDNEKIEVIPAPKKVEKTEAEAKKELEPLQAVKPTNEQIIRRCKESPEIKNMFNDIQTLLGKTIGYDSQAVLIMMHDHYGLPIEVIYMLVDYCNSIGKNGFSYIASVGKDWGEKEIDSIEKADEQIKILNECNGLWKEFARMAGIQNPRPSSYQSAYLRQWSQDMKFNVEMIYLAYEEMLNHSTRISFPYMNKVLATWHSKGIKTPEDIENEKLSFKKTLEQEKAKEKPSYNTDEFESRAIPLPVYHKGATSNGI